MHGMAGFLKMNHIIVILDLYEDDEFDDSCFNDYEKTNIQRLASYRDSGTEN